MHRNKAGVGRRHMDLVDLADLKHAFRTDCGMGYGMAACPALGVVVTTHLDDWHTFLSVWALPEDDCTGGALKLVYTMRYGGIRVSSDTGYLAFTAGGLLLVTDLNQQAVLVVDVVARSHVGYVAPPGSIPGPRGVAVCDRTSLVAVSDWDPNLVADHRVHVFKGHGTAWCPVRVIGTFGAGAGQLTRPYGLRFAKDGSTIVVTDSLNHRISVFRADDGEFVCTMATGLWPVDIEEVGDGGWLVACNNSHLVEYVRGRDRRPVLSDLNRRVFQHPSALAIVPGLGLVVRDTSSDLALHIFATSDVLAMRAMAPIRVAWMIAGARSILKRRGLLPSLKC